MARSRGARLKRRFYGESAFGGYTDVDGTVAFYLRVNALLDPDAVVLDVGCGRGAYGEDPVAVRRGLRTLRGKCARVIGIDVDDAGLTNPFLDEFRRIDGPRWPVDDASVDLCVCDFVVEHVPDPEEFFREAARVLRPGGHLCIRTPNVASYFGVASRLVPAARHAAFLRRVQPTRKAEDVFPTVYRANTVGKLRRIFGSHGFGEHAVYGYEAEPEYLSFHGVAYLLGVLHQRLAPGRLRVTLFAFGRRDGAEDGGGESRSDPSATGLGSQR